MPYLYNIPAPTDQLSISQGQIQGNFNALGAIAGNGNPSSNSLNAGSGFNWINLPGQAANPPAGASFPAGNIGLYAGPNATTGQNELYINKTNELTVTQIPATASILSITSAPASGSNGWSYLPSGLIMQWGTVVGPFPAVGVWYTRNFNFTFPNQTLMVTLQAVSDDVPPAQAFTYNYLTLDTNYTTSQFTFLPRTNIGNVDTRQVTYFAIGY